MIRLVTLLLMRSYPESSSPSQWIRFLLRMYCYNVPSKSDVWDTQTFVSTNPFYPCTIMPHCLEIILLYFSFKRVFGSSLTEQTGAIDQDPQNSAGKYFMDKNYSESLCYFVLKSYLNLPFIIFMQLYLQGTFGNQFLDLTFCKVLNDLFCHCLHFLHSQ